MILRLDRVVQTAQGQAIAGAQVYVLLQPADVDELTPLATVYADSAGTPGTNPALTDGMGQVALYLDNTKLYTLVVVSPLLVTQVYPDQNLGNQPSSASITPFAAQPAGAINGVNTIFTLPFTPTFLILQYNQGALMQGVGFTTAMVGGVFTITLAVAPQTGDALNAIGIR